MNPLDGYVPPIIVYQSELQTAIEDETLHVAQSMGVNVNREELFKALAYDRDQYVKGYEAGYNEAYREMHDFAANMRPATPEERQSCREYLDKISTPTGINIWNLFENNGNEN